MINNERNSVIKILKIKLTMVWPKIACRFAFTPPMTTAVQNGGAGEARITAAWEWIGAGDSMRCM